MQNQLQPMATPCSLIHPMVRVKMFTGLTTDRILPRHMAEAARGKLNTAIALIIAALAGASKFENFGLLLDVFAVAFIGFTMRRGDCFRSTTRPRHLAGYNADRSREFELYDCPCSRMKPIIPFFTNNKRTCA